MKGARLIIVIFCVQVLILGSLMAVLDTYNSWSEHALSMLEPLLMSVLIPATVIYMYMSTNQKDSGEIFKIIWKIPIRFRHIYRFTGVMFMCIALFPVTHESGFIVALHLIATALAIITAYISMFYFYPKGHRRQTALFGIIVGGLGFILGFIFKLYSVGTAEVIASLPVIIHILAERKTINP